MAKGTGNGEQLSIGERKGQLTIIEKVENSWRWRAICDCGQIRSDIDAWKWRNHPGAFNKCKDCAQPKKPVLGQRYGLVTVISEYKSASKGGRTAYVCVCNCGKRLHERTASVILRPSGTGCTSCHRKKQAKPIDEAGPRALYLEYRRGARKRNIDFYLSEHDVRQIINQGCFYCGVEPKQIHRRTGYVYNGIDRMDNLVGYKPWNSVPCCLDCNYAKRTRTIDDFIDWIERFSR